ncbi:hypothetical protein Ddye_027542 [Dipteronia dyeriana]|uniref:Retrotransposon gag domain-containing protein n=1 Tax=Dipteronia dyeriana TaxID=168575 RepID=A0AAD9TPR3_9ROSI|nr:hypothetical protein Ddye_027542 [Dipteronia dyeriana]
MVMIQQSGFSWPNNTSSSKVLLPNNMCSWHHSIWRVVALEWYRWYIKFWGPISWNEFTKVVLHRLDPTNYDDPSEALSPLKQTRTVNANYEAFEKLSRNVDGLPENFLVGNLILGLKDDIQLDVRVKHLKTLSKTISLAHLIEEHNLL